MPIDWDAVTKGIADDAEFTVGEQKVRGSDLKAYLHDRNSQIADREQRIKSFEPVQAENAQLKKQVSDMTAIFNAAAQMPQEQQPAGLAANLSPADVDPFDEVYGQDKVFGDFARKFTSKLKKDLQKDFSPSTLLEKEIRPAFNQLVEQMKLQQNLLFESRQKDEYRDAGEWPEGMSFSKAREEGIKRGMFVPNGQAAGYVDMRRLREDLMRPVEQERFIQKTKDEAMEEAVRQLRMSGNIIEMPNRGMGSQPKVVKAKGRTPDEIFGNVVNEAAQDTDTQRQLIGMMNGQQR